MKRTIDVRTCDRCGHTEQLHPVHGAARWGLLGASRGGKVTIGGDHGADLCNACLEGLAAWWSAGRLTVEDAA